MSTIVSAVYLHVVDVVVSKLREEFVNEGIDASVLTELQGMFNCIASEGPIISNSDMADDEIIAHGSSPFGGLLSCRINQGRPVIRIFTTATGKQK